MMEWISVEDRLPECSKTVQGYTDKHNWIPYCWVTETLDGLSWSYMNKPNSGPPMWFDKRNDKITHWMPLPEPPK